MDYTKKHNNPCPELQANFLSKIFFAWQIPLFRKGLKKDIEPDDIYNAREVDTSQPLGDLLETNWNKELENAKLEDRKPRFYNALFATFWKRYYFWGVLQFFYAVCLKSTVPLALAKVIQYFNHLTLLEPVEGYLYAGALILGSYLGTTFAFHVCYQLQILGMRARIATCSLMYRKLLRLSQTSLRQVATGKVVNLMSNDVHRFDQALMVTNFIWIVPIQLIFMSFLMYQSMGISVFGGVALLVIQGGPIQSFVSYKISKLRLKVAKRTDERVRVMSEIIAGIQVIKMYAWEKPFAAIVRLARKNEIKNILVTSYFRGISTAIVVYSERLAQYITIITYVLLGNELNADQVFSIAQFYNVLQMFATISLPLAITARGEGLVSVKRVEEFLLMEENQNSIKDSIGKSGTIMIRGVNTVTPTLRNINMQVQPGQLIGVMGSVGSGKTSILNLILNELPSTSGDISVSGKVSFCSQEPWLFQTTLQNNIIFGLDFEEEKYQDVVDCCALRRDLQQLPYGDKSLVGDRGASLSGGQRARVNLARSVYREADIYLFDDPLSAVDTHVGKHLFERCIRDYLKGKTRVLVTHQLQFLKDVDLVIVVDQGEIIKSGTWEELSDDETVTNITKSEDVIEEESEVIKYFEETVAPVVQEEEKGSGLLPGKIFWQYLRAGAHPCFLGFVFVLFIIAQVFCTGCDYWLSIWTTNEDIARRYVDQVDYLVDNSMDARVYINLTTLEENEDSFLSHYSGDYLPSRKFTILVYTALITGTVLLTTVSRLIYFKVSMNSSKNLHNKMFTNILEATMRFFDTNPSGRILNRFSKDMGAVDETLPKAIVETVQIFFVMLGICTMIAVVNPYLIILMIVGAFIYNKLRIAYLKTAQDVKRLEGVTRSPTFSHVSASLQGITTIRSCGAQELLQKEFDEQQDVHTGAFFLTVSIASAFGYWMDCTTIIFLTLITGSCFMLDKDNTSSGFVGLILSQTMILTGMLQYGMYQSAQVMNQMTNVERILQYMNLEKEGAYETAADKQLPKDWPSSGNVEFKHMSLCYNPEDGPVLKDLEVNIPAGNKIGIVGRTGAGKSSLVAALFRLARIEGDIEIDGISTKSIGLRDLRSRMSIIPQSPVLFSGSLRYNLDPLNQVDDAALWQALEEVELKDAGLDCEVQNEGANFSMGQRQLICLARAIVRNNKVLVLDEATANIDLETDRLIQQTIREKFAKCTVLTIAHRLNTIMDSDKVLVMDAGRAVEYDHPYLLLQKTDSIFSKMVAQTGAGMERYLKKIAEESYINKINEDHPEYMYTTHI